MIEVLLTLLLLALIGWYVVVPLRGSRVALDAVESPELANLRARKEAKLEEIRELRLDRDQGKLTDSEWDSQNAEMRAEAIAIIAELDAAEAAEGASATEDPADR